MGIRYYAYPVDGEFTELARVSPRMFMSIDPLADAWGLVGDRPEMLYLDKCWRDLQDLLGAKPDRSPRPAYDLVSGNVVMHHDGWEPFIRTLDPDQVATVADDIVRVTEAEVAASSITPSHRPARPPPDPPALTRHNLEHQWNTTSSEAQRSNTLRRAEAPQIRKRRRPPADRWIEGKQGAGPYRVWVR